VSEQIKHECGIVLLRLLKPLEYYAAHYGSRFFGLDKLYLLMEKQHNRGQDGAGIGCIKLDMPPGTRYMNRVRSNDPNPIKALFDGFYQSLRRAARTNPGNIQDVQWLKENLDFTGELFLGHLRYGTFGRNSINFCHPFQRENNWMSKNLMIAGNFNLTNVEELFDSLVTIGQHPNETSDTVTILEKLGHFLDEENEELYRRFKKEGHSKKEISPLIAEHLDLGNVLMNASKYWDGGYVIAGMTGHGDSFVMRDPNGIRPAYYYQDDEVVVATSERPVIQTAFNVPLERIQEVQPGHALIVKKDGRVSEIKVKEPGKRTACSFERIYFSRGTDADIYQERKNLGRRLVPSLLKAIHYDLENAIFSYIPNTAISAFKGMVEELNAFCDREKKDRLLELYTRMQEGPGDYPRAPGKPVTGSGDSGSGGAGDGEPVVGDGGPASDANVADPDVSGPGKPSPGKPGFEEELGRILSLRPRVDQVAVKDAKLRTFITEDTKRDDLVAHVYDVTYGLVRRGVDTLVVIDDSIVRGTTLKQSIVRILDRLGPKKILIVSSAPQIRYPDCYGIDMTKLSDFIAFRAAIELLKDTGRESVINEVYRKCKSELALPGGGNTNHVKEIYKPFCPEEISAQVAKMLHPPQVAAELQIVFQTIEDLHAACPGNTGDWYFTGNYPTPGGNKVANRSFVNYIEGRNERAY
jgi:amidophosphoribosyltransferase